MYVYNQSVPRRTISGKVDKAIIPVLRNPNLALLVRHTKPFLETELVHVDPMHLAPYF